MLQCGLYKAAIRILHRMFLALRPTLKDKMTLSYPSIKWPAAYRIVLAL